MNKDGFSYLLQQMLKRVMDITVSLAALLLLSALLLLIAFMIRLDSPGGPIYRHKRIGKGGRPFRLYKFRSMVAGGDDSRYLQYLKDLIASAQEPGGRGLPYLKIEEDGRITRVGRLLRCYYLDELPQLLNVLRGEMSLVGPRPHVQLEVDSYTPEQRRRLTVKPGITGRWQVEGKADYTFSELIESDLDYIDHWTLWLDVIILFKTFLLLLRGGEKFWTHMAKRVASTQAVPDCGSIPSEADIAPISVQPAVTVEANMPATLAQAGVPTNGSQSARVAVTSYPHGTGVAGV